MKDIILKKINGLVWSKVILLTSFAHINFSVIAYYSFLIYSSNF